MPYSIENQILIKIKKARRGTPFFIRNFTRFGSSKAISKALQRLVAKGKIIRVARGIYCRPRKGLSGNPIKPGAQEIAKAMARTDRATLIPTGSMALYQMGLSTQVPLRVVYLTDGTPRKITLGRQSILFKKTASKTLAIRGERSQLAVQALKAIGKDGLTTEEESTIVDWLKKEKTTSLEYNLSLVQAWIQSIFRKALNGVTL